MNDLLFHIKSIQNVVHYFKRKKSDESRHNKILPNPLDAFFQNGPENYSITRPSSQFSRKHDIFEQNTMRMGSYRRNERKSRGQRMIHMARLLAKAQRYL